MLRPLKRLAAVCAAMGLAMAVGTRVEAAPISGSVTFSGHIRPVDFLTTNSIDVDFITDDALDTNAAKVLCAQSASCTGSYASLFGNVNALYNDFTFNPLPGVGYVPLWAFSFGGKTYSFDLSSVTEIVRASSGIILAGSGLAHITGLDNTEAKWSFSADSAGLFAFSPTIGVPDAGSTMTLLGAALFGLAAVARRRQSRK